MTMVILESYARAAGVSKSVASWWWKWEPYFSKESNRSCVNSNLIARQIAPYTGLPSMTVATT